MYIPFDSIRWLRKYRATGTEFFSVYRNGQIAVSAALIRRLGLDPSGVNTFRAGESQDGNLTLQFIPQAEHNTDSGDTWKMTGSVSSFNVKAMLGWDAGKRYRYDIDPEQMAILVYKNSGYDHRPNL